MTQPSGSSAPDFKRPFRAPKKPPTTARPKPYSARAAFSANKKPFEASCHRPILSAHLGNNADLLPHILELYVPNGSTVADVTHGKGAFWTRIDTTKYDLRPTDLLTGVDFRKLSYEPASIDCLILDPPYMHGGPTIKPSLNDCYHNANTGHESVIRLYAGGLLEAARVLRKKGICIVKCQDETESGKQCFSHVELIQLLEMFGFAVVDLFVMVQNTIPIRGKGPQKSARKNHSYALVARFRR